MVWRTCHLGKRSILCLRRTSFYLVKLKHSTEGRRTTATGIRAKFGNCDHIQQMKHLADVSVTQSFFGSLCFLSTNRLFTTGKSDNTEVCVCGGHCV